MVQLAMFHEEHILKLVAKIFGEGTKDLARK